MEKWKETCNELDKGKTMMKFPCVYICVNAKLLLKQKYPPLVGHLLSLHITRSFYMLSDSQTILDIETWGEKVPCKGGE